MKLWWNENSNVSHLLLLLLPNINRTLVPLKSAAEGKNDKKHCNFLERKMPLNETKELTQIVDETILPMEHSGGDGWTILARRYPTGNPSIQAAGVRRHYYRSSLCFGRVEASEKNRTTNQKYSSMDKENALPDFDGDQKDQRSWTRWMAEWLSDARKACKPGAPICLFIDWRQYPSITDALQWAGWIWRGCAVWDKMTSRPQKGRFRQQSEYIVWGFQRTYAGE